MKRLEKLERYNLTFPQNNIYSVEKVNNNMSITTIGATLKICGKFNEVKCRQIINELIRLNEALRLKIFENKKAYQSVDKYTYKEIEYVDFSSGETSNKEAIFSYMEERLKEPFELINSDLYEFKIIRENENDGYIFMKLHHIISDAWSIGTLANLFIKLYDYDNCCDNCNDCNNELTKKEEKLEVPSYLEYIKSENEYIKSEKYIKDELFWREYLEGIGDSVSLKSSSKKISNKANRYKVVLDKAISDKIYDYCKVNKISPYVLFLTAISTYVYRVKDVNDMVIGTPTLNRSNFKEKQMVGMFVSTLPLRVKINEEIKFLDLAKDISSNTSSVFRHQKYPITKTLEHIHNNTDIKGNIYNIMLSYQNVRAKIENSDDYSTNWLFSNYIQNELEIHILDMDNSGLFHINYDYFTDLFEEFEIKYLHTRLVSIIENAMSILDVDVENIKIMSKEEENKILNEFNNTKVEYDKTKTVVDLFYEQVDKSPEDIAVIFENESITYNELNKRSNIVANYLIKKGIKNGDVVGLFIKRSIDIMTLIIGILKSGAGYLPIDSTFPEDRINYIIKDSKLKLVLTNIENNEFTNIDQVLINKSEKEYTEVKENEKDVKINIDFEDTFNLLYTSGSTGNPKGVNIKHGSLMNFSNYYKNNEVFKNINTIISITTVSFDIFAFESIIPLLLGKKIVIGSEEQQKLPNLLLKCIIKNNVELLQATPTRMKFILSNIANIANIANLSNLATLKKVVLAGERLPYDLKKDLVEKNIKVYNGYGPTETTIFASFTNVTNEKEITVGKPFYNTYFYIKDKKERILPIGIPGVLYIAGDMVCKGYINNKELNEKLFKIYDGKMQYNSGDLCYIDFNLKTICLGRNDNQIKINGLRIELSEIEQVIRKYENINEAVAIKKDNKIVLYITLKKDDKDAIDIKKIKIYLGDKLPRYMLPSNIIVINEMPLTPNAKIDKLKLESYNIIEKNLNEYVKPNTKIEKELYKLIKKNIKKDFSIEEELISLGLDSLNIVTLLMDINNKFKIDISIGKFTNNLTIKDIASIIENSKEIRNTLSEVKIEQLPLSYSQKLIYLSYLKNSDSLKYNMPGEVVISKDIDVLKLQKSLEYVINNNDIFKCNVEIKENKPFLKLVDKHIDVKLTDIGEKAYIDKKVNFVKAFDLLSDNLIRVNIYKTDENIYLLFDAHHIIFDGVSMSIFIKQVQDKYNDKDVIINNNYFNFLNDKNVLEAELEETETEKTNMLNKPNTFIRYDFSKTKENEYVGNKLVNLVNKELSKKIIKYSKENNVTLNGIFLSAVKILLSKYTYSDEVVLGVANFGRDKYEYLNTIGMFVQSLPYFENIKYNQEIIKYLEKTSKEVLNLKESKSQNLFNIMYTYQSFGVPKIKFGKSVAKINEFKTYTAKFDLTFEIIPKDKSFEINLEYNNKLYKQKTIFNIFDHLINILNEIVNKETKCKLKDINIASNKELEKISNMNYNKTNYPKDKTIVKLFEESVNKTPDNIAVFYEDKYITYKELNEKSNMLARYLIKEKNVNINDVVIVSTDKKVEMMICIIAILKCGAAYLPIDKSFPKERISFMKKDANCKVEINEEDMSKCSLGYSSENLDLDFGNDKVAYIMYTSGSTGNPKGVMITHKNVVRLVCNTNYIKHKKNDRVIQTGAISFDASTFEYYFALFNSLPLYLIPKEKLLDGVILKKYIDDNKITVMWLTSPLFNALLDGDIKIFENIRVLLVGGDVLSVKHINKLMDTYPNIQIINGYGPTENTTFSVCNNINKTYENNIPIGIPISNSTAYVVDNDLNKCGINIPGELLVGGDGVCKGYLNNEKLNKEKFTFLNKERVYKTGDLVLINSDLEIEFIQRLDNQVKVNGYRVELNEISNKILEDNKIKECVTIVLDNKITSYFVSDFDIAEDSIKNTIRKKLPSYMIPSKIIKLDKIPLNQNGKVDNEKLIAINERELNARNSNEKKDKIILSVNAKKIADLFEETLNISNVNINDNFFEIGGDSLLVTKLITNAMAKNIHISYSDIFKYQTVNELSRLLDGDYKKESISSGIEKYDYLKIDKLLNNQGSKKEKKNNKDSKDDQNNKGNIGNVLLTGVTGFLGAHILDSFMKKETGKIYCLVRDKNDKSYELRIKEILRFFFGNKYDDEFNKRIFIVEGDITNRNIIQNKDIYNEVIKNINTVINSAAHVKHYGNSEEFYKINVEGSKNIVDFCMKNTKKLIHISTLSISGNIIESGQVEQENIKEGTSFDENKLYIGQNLDNIYAYTKFLSERYILENIPNGLNAKIMRMGNLTGRVSDGKFQPNVEENAFAARIKTLFLIKLMPENLLEFYMEFTPIDYSADAILKLSKENNDDRIVYHLFNDKHADMKFVEKILIKLGLNLKRVSKEKMKIYINEIIKDKENSKKINGIISDLNKNKELDYISNIKVLNNITNQLLEKEEFTWYDIDEEYITKYINYLKEIKFI